jgi:type IV pilus assembly protein PilA
MLHAVRRRAAGRPEQGFTLTELMVVVLIIAILIAIAVPTFLGARRRAQDRRAQSDLRNTFTAEKVHYADQHAYTQVKSDLTAIAPSLALDDVADSVPAGSSVAYVVSGEVVTLAARSDSGTCFYLRDDPAGATTYARGTCEAPSATTNPFSADGWK